MRCEAENDQIVTGWTRERTKHEAMAQLSAVGVPVGAVLEPMELTNEPSFRRRGILQTMTHGERTMMMPNWPVRFDGVPTAVKSAPLLGEHTAEVLAEWLGLDAAAVPGLASGRHRLRRWRPAAGSVRPGRKRRPCSLAGSTPRGSPLTGDKFESISLQRRVRLSPASPFEGREPRLSARFCFSPKKSGPDHWVPVISREGGKRTRQPCRKPRKAGLPPSTGSRWYASFGDGEPVISTPRFGSVWV